MMGADYKTKKELKKAVGQPLRYVETSAFGPETKKARQETKKVSDYARA